MDVNQSGPATNSHRSTQKIAAEWLKDEDLRPYDDREVKAQRMLQIIVITFLGWTVFFVFHLISKATPINSICQGLGALFSLVIYLWLRLDKSETRISIAGHLIILVTSLAITGSSLVIGQSDALGSWFLVATPLIASYGLGTKQAIYWALVSCVLITFLHFSEMLFDIPQEWLSEPIDLYVGRLVLVMIVLFFGLAARYANSQILTELKRRESIILDQARANKLQSQALEVTRDKALAAAKAKSEFLANMSHEIRTPLNGVLGMTAMLETTSLNEEQIDILKTIQRSGELLLTIVNDVVDLSKIESGQLTLESVSFPLWDFVEETLELFSAKSWYKRIDLYCRFDPKVPKHIFGDPTRFRQILLNLIGNALKFTDEGEIVVLVDQPKANIIQVKVQDTGIGIPKDKLERLFKKFSQVDASTTRKFGGSGLGLAISKRLVELMGGKVSVASEEGQGSTFQFDIQAEKASALQPSSSDTIDRRWAGKKVLIIEPFAGSRTLLKDLVEQWSIVAFTASSLEEGIEQIKESKHLSAVFFSARLHPTESDLAQLRDAAPRAKLILLTSSGDSVYRAQADDLGFTASVLMPLRRKYIQRALQAGLLGLRPKSSSLGMAINPNFARSLPLSILVAEDNRTNQKVIQMIMKRLGYDIDLANNGLEALEALKSKDYDVILMDMHMPEMDGLTATQTIRKELPQEKQPKIIALTANVLPEQKLECRNAGMDDFISKPLQISQLKKALLRCV